jgi:hypothetical protein
MARWNTWLFKGSIKLICKDNEVSKRGASDRPRRLLCYARRAARQSAAKGGEDIFVSLVEGASGGAGIVHGLLRYACRHGHRTTGHCQQVQFDTDLSALSVPAAASSASSDTS